MQARRVAFWSGGVAGGLSLALFLAAALFSGCVNLQMPEAEIAERFESGGLERPRELDVASEGGTVRVVVAGALERPAVVFVHGSPGGWTDYIGFFGKKELRERYCLIGVDRPGFGATTPLGAEPSLEAQARRIHEAVMAVGERGPFVWVGHSLGGPVVARVAVDFPQSAQGLVLVAPSIDPELERRRWFNWAGKVPPIRWGLGRYWRNSNDEIFPLKAELKELDLRAGALRVPVVVVQGEEDSLVPPGNADYARRAYVNARVEVRLLPGVDHFIPWSNPEEIEAALERVWEMVGEE